MQVLNIPRDKNITITTALNDINYRINIRYLDQEFGGWFISIFDPSTVPVTPIISGARLTNFSFVFGSADLIDGNIITYPLSTPFSEIDRTSKDPWGVTHELVFLTRDEYEAI